MSMQFTYATLSAALQNWMEDSSVELVDEAMPQIIGLAEQRLLKDMQLSTFDAVLTGTFTQGAAVMVKPESVVQTIALFMVRSKYRTIESQDETDFDGAGANGTFAGGTGYSSGDLIVMSDGTLAAVALESAGVVMEFDIISGTPRGSGSIRPNQTLTQASVAPTGGTGFTLTLGDDNETLDADDPKRDELDQRTLSYLRDFQAGTDEPGIPLLYADINDSTWAITPRANHAYSYEALCVIRPDSLIEYETIAAQDETDFDAVSPNGSFSGGSGYVGADTIVLSDGTVVTVDTEAAGVVTEFTVTTPSTNGGTVSNPILQQTSSSGGGTGFSLTLGNANQQFDERRTSWLSTRTAELMLYACLIEAEGFIKADLGGADRAAKWEGQYNGSLEKSRVEMRRWLREAYFPMRVNQGSSG